MKYIFLVLIFLFAGCSSIPTVEQRIKTSNELVKKQKVQKKIYKTKNFSLYSLNKVDTCRTLRVYIEGDGLAWISRTRVSSNPTPINPIGQKLFFKDESTCKIYLSRPCQYVKDKKCEKKYWTSHRFSKEVLNSYLETFETLKKEHQNKNFKIIGFSGGATLATLVTANRNDILSLITVAGNLDHKYWTKKHNITLLNDSLNPVDYVHKLKDIKQVHLIGGKDKIIDESIYNSYISYFKDTSNIRKIVFKEYSHQDGWEENWSEILKKIF